MVMNEMLHKPVPPHAVGSAIICTIAIVAAGYFSINHYISLKNERIALETQVKQLSDVLKVTEDANISLQNENARLHEELETEQTKLERATSRADALRKLNELDPKLLQKYSKVYFLNEHYTPETVVDLDPKYVYPAGRTVQISKDILPYLEDLLDEAAEDGIELYITSGYRSFETQQAIKTQNRITYGAGTANSFVADQGYSEHQLGTTVDFTTRMSGLTAAFEKTPAYEWLQENAHRYGFILSYPKDNAYYIFEPWHWRYVGESLSRYLKRENKNFYDLDQRQIDTFLPDIFE
jgi:LAS superfamily LD-carboxypeptidase LdcB